MPKKLRKMLGDVNSPSVVALRELIDTQSKDTILKWVLVYTANQMLPIFERHCPDDTRQRKVVDAAAEVINGKIKPSAVKNIIKECQIAYDRVGLDASKKTYAEIAEEVCLVYTSALRSIAIENEPNPVRLKWNC